MSTVRLGERRYWVGIAETGVNVPSSQLHIGLTRSLGLRIEKQIAFCPPRVFNNCLSQTCGLLRVRSWQRSSGLQRYVAGHYWYGSVFRWPLLFWKKSNPADMLGGCALFACWRHFWQEFRVRQLMWKISWIPVRILCLGCVACDPDSRTLGLWSINQRLPFMAEGFRIFQDFLWNFANKPPSLIWLRSCFQARLAKNTASRYGATMWYSCWGSWRCR